jgi:hypothetical protein
VEQHSASVAHALLSVLHPGLSGAHVPPEQFPLQHEGFEVHAWPSEMQGGRPHTPPAHVPEQQSIDATHATPIPAHPMPELVPLELPLHVPLLVEALLVVALLVAVTPPVPPPVVVDATLVLEPIVVTPPP